MNFLGKIGFMKILKIIKNQSFMLSMKYTLLEKVTGGWGQIEIKPKSPFPVVSRQILDSIKVTLNFLEKDSAVQMLTSFTFSCMCACLCVCVCVCVCVCLCVYVCVCVCFTLFSQKTNID